MRFVLLAALLALPAAGQGVYTYRLRGEVRLLLFWTGKDDVGGGRVTVSPTEIEVLFGSKPERIPGKINRWGYGRETAEWADGSPPRLAATEFLGIMRHSAESSIDEAVSATEKAAASGQYLYDTTLSKVLPDSAWHEIRVLAEPEDFDYRNPERLLGNLRKALASTPPLRRGQLTHQAEPYGFLTGLQELIRRASERRALHSLVFLYDSTPYNLEIMDIQPVPESKMLAEWRVARARDVIRIRFRSFNTVKRTRTDFELWIPTAGDLKGIPVRILLQPRWWLRLRMDFTSATAIPEPGTK